MSRLFVAQNHSRGSGLAAWGRTPRRRSRRGSRHLFDRWAEIRSRLAVAPSVTLFLDFDGTLAPLRPHPEEARLEPGVRKVLARLARQASFTLCIISGRRLADLRRRAGVRGVHYIGIHGWEHGGRGRSKNIPESMMEVKRRVCSFLGSMAGVWVEDKGITCAVHYRGATESVVRRARAAFRKAVEPLADTVQVMKGKKIWEVMPTDMPGKGKATLEFLTRARAGTLAFYIGDDTTDETAFRVLREGITVRVGPARRTLARFRLRDPGEVRVFLERLAEELP